MLGMMGGMGDCWQEQDDMQKKKQKA